MTTFRKAGILLLIALSGTVSGICGIMPEKPDTLRIWRYPASQISADPIGQLYQVREGILVKYDSSGDSIYSWSDPATGRITFTDTGDPMRILVYQREFNLVRFLNNRLAPLSGSLHLDDVGLTSPLALATSRRGGFWVLDGSTLQLKHINQQLNVNFQSSPLILPEGSGTAPIRLIESGDQLMLLIPGREIMVFDLFANFVRKMPVGASAFHPFGKFLVLVYPDRVTLLGDAVSPEQTVLSAPPGESFTDACPAQEKWLIGTAKRVFLIRQ
jgi:hypothetical protein